MAEDVDWESLGKGYQLAGGSIKQAVVRAATQAALRFEVCCCAVLCCAVLCCAVLCCAVLCCAVLCCAVPCRAVPCRCCAVL